MIEFIATQLNEKWQATSSDHLQHCIKEIYTLWWMSQLYYEFMLSLSSS